jgi:hypothetical protein
MEKVESLSTIGCPFDLVRMLQPRYFKDRFAPANPDVRWINIYDPIDMLGSNFRNDTKHDLPTDEQCKATKATEGVMIICSKDARGPTRNISWNSGQRLGPVNFLLLASLRVHSQYWGSNPHGDTALGCLASELFGGTQVLQ